MYISPSLLQLAPELMPNAFAPGYALAWQIINGTVYLFAAQGDQVPLHSHPEGQTHTVGVMHGSIIYRTVNADGTFTDQQIDAPAMVSVPANVEHALICASSPVNTSGPVVSDSTTLGAICVNVRMAAILPAQLKAGLQALNADAATFLANAQAIAALTV
jgi:hypothetical protein